MSKTYVIRNNYKRIGKAKQYNRLKELIFAGGVMTLVGSTVLGISNITSEQYNKDKLSYTVQNEDNLEDIVSVYENDPYKVEKDIEKIVKLNNLENRYDLTAGEDITLVGVDEDKKILFDSLESKVDEMLARYEYVDTYKEYMERTRENESRIIAFYILYDSITDFINEKDYTDESKINNVLNKLEMMSNTVRCYMNEDGKKLVKNR